MKRIMAKSVPKKTRLVVNLKISDSFSKRRSNKFVRRCELVSAHRKEARAV